MTSPAEESTRQRILREGTRLVRRKGLTATSISDLVEAAEIQRGSLYHYFSGKHELALAILQQAAEQFLDFLRRSLVGESPRERLHSFLNAAAEKKCAEESVGACIFGNTALEASDSDPELAAIVRNLFDEWAATLQPVIDEGQQQGEFREDMPSEMLARHIVIVLEGGLMQTRLRQDEEPFRQSIQCIKAFLEGNTDDDTEETDA